MIDVRITFRVAGRESYALTLARAVVAFLEKRANVLDRFRIETKEARV